MQSAVCWDDRFATHDMGRGGMYLPCEGLVEDDLHIDNTARIVRTRNALRIAGVDGRVAMLSPREATVDEVLRVHSEEHVLRMQAVSASGSGDAGGGYTPMDDRSYSLALLSAGSALSVLEAIARGDVTTAHAMLRRSGHHAWSDSGYGFCVFNNAAIAARSALEDHGFSRVVVVDIDAHHGNGTEAIFVADPRVLTISIHQDRSFPVETGGVETVGEGDGEGTNVNINLPAGAGDPAYLDALDRIVAPILAEYRPEFVIVACGVDASLFDPMARMGVTATGFAQMAERLVAIAGGSAQGRLLSIQEGGYSHVYAPLCWLAFVETIAGLDRHSDPFEPFVAGQAVCRELSPSQVEANDATRRALAPYWKCF